jgi:hypothetical protein
MKTFCTECMKETESTLYAEVRECNACGKMWECPGNPETTALRNKIQRHADDLALHCEQYNAGVEAAKAGKVCGPRPELDTSTYYDGYAATMLPVLRERIAELEAALKSFFARAIVTDTNGDYCLICDGMDLDHEGVIHHKDCPVFEAERVLEGGAE